MYCVEGHVDQLMRDISFLAEELDIVLKKLKSGKSAGHSGVQVEHLKFSYKPAMQS